MHAVPLLCMKTVMASTDGMHLQHMMGPIWLPNPPLPRPTRAPLFETTPLVSR